MKSIQQIITPAAVIDTQRMQYNITRMQERMDGFAVRFRPHVKTTKCLPVVHAQMQAGAQGITVSTLKEAEQFFAAGITNILYAVGMVPGKLEQALRLRQRGCDLKIVVDNVVAAREVALCGRQHDMVFEVWIEIDSDGHRSGIKPEQACLLEVAGILQAAGMCLGGVMTHAGSSYDEDQHAALLAVAEQERMGAVRAAQRLRTAGFSCPEVSIGSTPTALVSESMEGVTEVRAGVYVFFDLVMRNIGVCTFEEIALSVLTTVIGHQEEKGWIILDAGWMALSRDRGTQKQRQDFGFGQACTLEGDVLPGYIVHAANQEHGILSCTEKNDSNIMERFPIGTRLRILPNHACATGAQHPAYEAILPNGNIETWPRFYGW